MNDRTMETPDWLGTAAKAELDAIHSRLEATWDTEAGLREILLEEHYHRFIGEQSGVFDVEASLADVLARDAQHPEPESLEVDTQRLHVFLAVVTAAQRDWVVPAQPNTFDRVRLLAQSVLETLEELTGTVREELQERRQIELAEAYIDALAWVDELNQLADGLQAGVVGLERALAIVRGTALALMEVYDQISVVWDPETNINVHPHAPRVLDLAVDVNNLERPIKRLFEPSDDVVHALR